MESTASRVVAVVAILLGVLLVAAPVFVDPLFATETLETLTPEGLDEVVRIDARNVNGAVRISRGPRVVGSAMLDVYARFALRAPTPVVEVEDGVLTLRDGCPEGFIGSCQVDFLVLTPADAEVEVTTTNGEVRVGGGTAPVTVRTVNGDVGVSPAGVAVVDVEMVNGSFEGRWDTDAGPTRVETVNGGITLRLPGGPYDVAARTTNGPVDVQVPTDPSGPRLELTTTNGPITAVTVAPVRGGDPDAAGG
ncbi:MAG: DUF4097 family beta strand repeat-containing protein [Actinomycetes bacterium]